MTGNDDDRRATAAEGPDAGEVVLGDGIDALLADPILWEQPPAELADDIVAAVRSESVVGPPISSRSAASWVRPALLGAVAVAVFLIGGIVVFSAVNGPDGTEQFSADLIPTGLVADVDGSIDLTSFDSGLRIDLDAPSLPRREGGQFYEAWLRTGDGLLIPVGTFHDGDAVTLWAGVERERVAAFTITLEEAVAPDSVDQRSSGNVVFKVDIPAP